MINLLRVWLFIGGFIVGANYSIKNNPQSHHLEMTKGQQPYEQTSQDTLTWEDRSY